MVMFIGEAEVQKYLDWKSLIAAMETALIGFSAGRVIQPVRNMLTIEEGKRYLGIMPAVADETMGLKLVCFYPGNAGTSVPTHTAMIFCFAPKPVNRLRLWTAGSLLKCAPRQCRGLSQIG